MGDAIYAYTAPSGYMSESPAQDAGLYRRHLQQIDQANKDAGINSLKDQALLVPLAAGGTTALHGLRGLARVLRGSSDMPFETGATGLGWQGAKILGGAGLGYGANSVMDMPVDARAKAFMDAVRAAPAVRREDRYDELNRLTPLIEALARK